jgi:hypothetical protein
MFAVETDYSPTTGIPESIWERPCAGERAKRSRYSTLAPTIDLQTVDARVWQRESSRRLAQAKIEAPGSATATAKPNRHLRFLIPQRHLRG